MRFVSWNVRGLNKIPHQKVVINFISSNQMFLIGLLEAKVKSVNACVVAKKINKSWNWIYNYKHHPNGRVWVGWDPSVWHLSVHSKSAQHITCTTKFLEKNIVFLISFIYAFNDGIDRVPLWTDLSSLNSTSLPWCLAGDFNCILSLDEVSGGREHWTPEMQTFKDCIFSIGLDHIHTTGDLFTWTNKRHQNPIFRRLDRMLANGSWHLQFTEGNVFVHNRGIMDHNPLVFISRMDLQKFGKPFQFFNFMLDLPDFLTTVAASWHGVVTGNPLDSFCKKLKIVKQA